MYCRIYEPGRTIVCAGDKLKEIYFISKGTAIFYDRQGITPFIQLPQHSQFGDYQLIFDLRCSFVVKVGGKENIFNKFQNRMERTTFLCVPDEYFQELLELFPKSKNIVLKRALERRKVWTNQLEKLEVYMAKKKLKTKYQKKTKELENKKKKLIKVIRTKRQQMVPEN